MNVIHDIVKELFCIGCTVVPPNFVLPWTAQSLGMILSRGMSPKINASDCPGDGR